MLLPGEVLISPPVQMYSDPWSLKFNWPIARDAASTLGQSETVTQLRSTKHESDFGRADGAAFGEGAKPGCSMCTTLPTTRKAFPSAGASVPAGIWTSTTIRSAKTVFVQNPSGRVPEPKS